MINFKDGGLLEILPPNIKNNIAVQCFCYVIDKQIKKLIIAADRIMIWGNSDNWNHDICDNLAAELRTPFYSYNLDINTKRKMVKNTLLWYSRLGTVGAVEEIVESVLGYAKIECGSKAYTFRLKTNDLTIFGEKEKKFKNQLNNIKNARSQYEGTVLILQNTIMLGAYCQIASSVCIQPYNIADYVSNGAMQALSLAKYGLRILINPKLNEGCDM